MQVRVMAQSWSWSKAILPCRIRSIVNAANNRFWVAVAWMAALPRAGARRSWPSVANWRWRTESQNHDRWAAQGALRDPIPWALSTGEKEPSGQRVAGQRLSALPGSGDPKTVSEAWPFRRSAPARTAIPSRKRRPSPCGRLSIPWRPKTGAIELVRFVLYGRPAYQVTNGR